MSNSRNSRYFDFEDEVQDDFRDKKKAKAEDRRAKRKNKSRDRDEQLEGSFTE